MKCKKPTSMRYEVADRPSLDKYAYQNEFEFITNVNVADDNDNSKADARVTMIAHLFYMCIRI